MSYSQLFDEIITVIKTVWDEIGDGQIYTSYEALRQNIVERDDLIVPFVVIDAGNRVEESGFSTDTLQYRLPLQIWYITTQGTLLPGSSAQMLVADKGHQLATYTRSHNGTYWCEIEAASIDASMSEEFNAKVAIEGKTEFIASCTRWEPGLLIDGTV